VIGAIAVLGYAYNVQPFYRFAGYSSMALHTAVSLLALATGLICARPDGLSSVLTTPGPAAQLARRLLPVVLLAPAVLGWLVGWGRERGVCGEGMDLAVLALAMMLSLAALVWWTAHVVNRADIARRESETQLRNQAEVMNHAHDALIVRELGGVILFWNHGAEALYGWPADDAIGQRIHVLFRTDPAVVEQSEAALRQNGRWEGELVHTTHDSRRVTVESRKTAACAADGRLLILESNRDITERKQAEEQIKASLDEKEVLLKEIHHRVKNNMQVISSLVALQAERLPDAAMREALQEVTHRVRSMALVHEKLYQSADMARIEFAEYARGLLNYLWRAYGTVAADVRLTLDLEPVPLSVNAAVPCGLVLNELASNALKHAFRGRNGGHRGEAVVGHEVVVSLRASPEGRICLRVRDNGTGLPPGLDWRQADSLGLRLVQMLAGQLDGTVEVSSGEGTEFTMTFEGTKA
jgi:PAS domain S-box-containing protein